MKANLKKHLGLAALGMTLMATTVPTWAGTVSTENVSIASNENVSWASGNLVDARDSADNEQNIGCIAHTLSSYSWTTCFATDSTNRKLFCGSGDWKFLEVLRGMTDSSRIFFVTGNNGDTACRHIQISNNSDNLK